MTAWTMAGLFTFEAARSHGVDDYASGALPFVTSTLQNNGVVGFVTPLLGDKIFDGPALAISGLGQATVQPDRFLPKGNGGDSITVCRPISAVTMAELISIAAAFNYLHSWRFSYGRKCSPGRIRDLRIPSDLPSIADNWADEALQLTHLTKALARLT